MKIGGKKVGADLILGTAGLIVMTLCVLLGIAFRWHGTPLLWTEEVAKWMMVWITFAGASYSFKHGGLLRVDFFVRTFCGRRAQFTINVAAMALMFLFFTYMSYSSVQYMLNTWNRNQVFPVTRVPFFCVTGALFIGGILTAVFSLGQTIKLLRGTAGDHTEEETP
ncbi:MAG: TRAP transporter small permease [Candidatus Accumulibacter sp.]|jgi:TRAP-type C4-dicarboxylate transport system permease small subunit|nr:TRAP transporter small permease [Accumulibacter sp.]